MTNSPTPLDDPGRMISGPVNSARDQDQVGTHRRAGDRVADRLGDVGDRPEDRRASRRPER